MTASCPYCHQAMRQPYPDNKGNWRCDPCHLSQELFSNGISIIWIHCTIKEIEYTVRLDGRDLGTQFIRWEQTTDGFDIGKIFLVIPEVANITPSNIVEKIKLYICFS